MGFLTLNGHRRNFLSQFSKIILVDIHKYPEFLIKENNLVKILHESPGNIVSVTSSTMMSSFKVQPQIKVFGA